MEPNYAAFWAAFKTSDAWAGLMSMGLYSDFIEMRILRLRVEMLDAINGHANQADIQESIWRLMDLAGSLSEDSQVQELVGLLIQYHLMPTYSLSRPNP
jgi:hypothetical protein